MSRPASSVDSVETITGKMITQQIVPTGSPVSSNVITASRWVRDISPAGGNSPKIGGIRKCRSWSRNGRDIRKDLNTVEVVRRTNGSGATAKDVYTLGSFWASGVTPPEALMPSTNMINRSVVTALNNIKGQDVHLGNFFAEADKTIALVSKVFGSLGTGVKRWRQANPKLWPLVIANQVGNLPRGSWCKIPRSWLEFQYGVRPLISDVYGALHHLSRVSRYDSPLITGVGTVSDFENSFTYGTSGGGFKWSARWKHERSTRCSLVYKPNNFVLAELSSLGLINPLEIVWELTRWSFIVDWAVPVGAWLSSITGDVGFTFVTGSQSSRSRMSHDDSFMLSVPTTFGVAQQGPGSGPAYHGLARRFTRTCYTSPPVPGLYVKNPLSFEHLANSLALLLQAFS